MTAQFRFLRMILRNQLHFRTNQHAVTNRYSATVHERAAAIHERVPAEPWETAEIGIKRRHDPRRFIDLLPSQFTHASPRLGGVMVARIHSPVMRKALVINSSMTGYPGSPSRINSPRRILSNISICFSFQFFK